MKRVANCILIQEDQILMLQKPKRGWWVAPGGKVEPEETVFEAAVREFHEETDLTLENPSLKGVFNIILKDGEETVEEWMLFTFLATRYSGELTSYCREGKLEWVDINKALILPKAKGDNIYLKHILLTNELITGKFIYTPEYELISYSIDNLMQKSSEKLRENVILT